jgi:ABC-type polysaccharide/polyol phosphate export permease
VTYQTLRPLSEGSAQMFQIEVRRTKTRSAFQLLQLIFHAAVRHVRKSHHNAIAGLILNICQILIFLGIMYFMSVVFGMRTSAVRGDYLLYMFSGIMMFMTHVKTSGAVAGADGPTSSMMKHSPMNTLVAISAAALGTLYQQILSVAVILYVYHAAFVPITIHDPVGTAGMMLLAWTSGIATGMILQAAKPWAPDAVDILTTIYQRINIIASGKMFLANAMTGTMVSWFDWNPLFHIIDQGRGFIFLNYHPHNSSLSYPVKATIVLMIIGLMAEYYTRKYASASWGAGK